MLGWFRRGASRQPQVWLVRSDASAWTKAVLTSRPRLPWHSRIGPFRSELDAEQTADHLNAHRDDRTLFYEPDLGPPEDGDLDEEFEDPADDDDGEGWKRASH